MKRVMLVTVISFFVASMTFAAGDGTISGKLDGQVLAGGSNRVLIFDETGKTLWEHKAGTVHDVWRLKNGNVLFADGEAKEIDPKDNKIVWQYKAEIGKGGGVYSCQRLKGGKTLIGENSTGRLLELDKDGKVTFELKLPDVKEGDHHNLRMVRKLKNGNYLVCHSGKRFVREYTPKGEIILELKAGNIAFAAVRLKNGNTLMGHLNNITEFDSKGEKVWEFNNKKDGGAEGVKITNMTGLHVLKNGNIVAGIYSSNRNEGGAALLELTREKKIVWRYVGKDAHMINMQKLTAKGKVLEKKPIH